MNTPGSPPNTTALEWYRDLWTASACQVLQSVAGEPFAAQPLSDEAAPAEIQKATKAGAWVRFSIGNPLAGEHAWLVNAADGLRLAQILMTEPLDDKAPFDGGHQNALAELFRQIAGAAATALSAKLGSEIQVEFAGTEPPAWAASLEAGFRLSGQRTGAVSFYSRLSAELTAALTAHRASGEDESSKEERRHSAAAARNGSHPANIDLLKEVELGVTLRFGERQVLLRDILELVPGAVIELDQQVEDPVELLVGKKVIARGEVVVVDGNYGLRVTEIVSPAERIESLRR